MPSQMVALDTPMLAVADALMVSTIVLTATVHPEAEPAVNVKVTVPAVISAELGV